ncbi:MAG: 2-dehydropantoate 2-reductase [Deltaproteobacteria bacterium]|jgi:2-dehydropantoate 2-reductase
MKIAIVGAGAMGSLFGSLLAEGGHEVWLYDIWQDHIQAVKQNGLEVEREGKTRNVRLNATGDRTQIGESELILIFVKSTQTRSAAESAALLAGRNGWVLTLQNGMGNAETIAKHIPPNRILAGTTAHGATMLKAGSIRHAGAGPTTVGMWAGGEKEFHIARKIADQFTQAGIECAAVEAIRPVIWDKLLVNVGINAITALTGIKNGQILDLEVTRELSRVAVEEAASVARARGIEIRKDPAAHVFKVAAATATNRSSMGQDVDQHRPTEIKAINGFVVREARSVGMTAPVNQALTALVETKEAHYRHSG